jgi:hypothetical protein
MKRFALLVGCVPLFGCSNGGSDPIAPPVPVLTTLRVALAQSRVQVGDATTATVSGADQKGAPIGTGAAVWSSTAGASVTSDGTVTAVSPGTATIVATAGGKTGQATLAVAALPAAALALGNVPPSSAVNRAALQPQPTVQLANANGQPVAQAGVAVTATVSTGAISGTLTATTDASGIAAFTDLALSGPTGARTISFAAVGLRPVTVSISLTVGVAATVTIVAGNQQSAQTGTAVPVPPSVRVTDVDGNNIAGASVAFDVTLGAGGVLGSPALSDANGVAKPTGWTLGAVGANALQAHLLTSPFGVSFTAIATAAPPALTSIIVSVVPSSLQVGASGQASATGRDQYGAEIATGVVTWSSSGSAAVSTAGVVRAVSAGTATIIAAAGGKSGQAQVVTTDVPVRVFTTLSVSVTPASIHVGETATAAARGFDQFGADIATGSITWSVTSAAAISQTGVVTGINAGVATVTAAMGGVSAQATVAITPITAPPTPVLTSLLVNVSPAAIAVGQSAQATVSGRDQVGASISTGTISWSSTPGVSIAASGVISGVAAGSATVTAVESPSGISAQAMLTVTAPMAPPTLQTLQVVVTPSTIGIGESAQAVAVARDQYGAPFTIPVAAQWFVSAHATITQTGVVTGTSAGIATVSVGFPGYRNAQTDVVVTGAPPTLMLSANLPQSTQKNRTFFVPQPSLQLVDVTTGRAVSRAGVVVTVAATNGGTLIGNTTAVTDSNGRATFVDLGMSGTVSANRQVSFAASGVSGALWTFALAPGNPASLAKSAGDDQQAFAGALVSVPPAIAIKDLDGNTVSDYFDAAGQRINDRRAITFTVTSGGGTISGASVTSDQNGQAALASWRLGTLGTNTVTASSPGLPTVTFTAIATMPPPPCGAPGTLVVDQTLFTRLDVSGCLIQNLRIQGPFAGPDIDGNEYYDRYLLDIPATNTVRLDLTSAPNSGFMRIAAYTESGAFVTLRATGLTLTNASSSTVRYQIIVYGSSKAAIGNYSLTPVRVP